MKQFLILDLATVLEGECETQAFCRSLASARSVECLGYHRFWLAEHHNMIGIATIA